MKKKHEMCNSLVHILKFPTNTLDLSFTIKTFKLVIIYNSGHQKYLLCVKKKNYEFLCYLGKCIFDINN